MNSRFDVEEIECVLESPDFVTLCLNELVLKNVLTGLHVTKGDYLEESSTNCSLRFAAYKQFTWWVFESLGKNNRRVLPSCAIWKIRSTYPESDGKYTKYSDGNKD